jgi:hypothetical protein
VHIPQVVGMMSLRPDALAFVQSVTSILILSKVTEMEGRSLSKMQAFLCFQVIHDVRSVAEARPLRMGFGVASLAVSHHSLSEGSPSGGRHISHSQDSVSCHTCLEKGHVMSK